MRPVMIMIQSMKIVKTMVGQGTPPVRRMSMIRRGVVMNLVRGLLAGCHTFLGRHDVPIDVADVEDLAVDAGNDSSGADPFDVNWDPA